jgi:hypothetical protein
MKRLRTLLSVPLVVACVLAVLSASAWARYANQHRPERPGPLDDADPEAKKALIAHDIGNVRMTLSNWGELGNPDATPGFKGFEFPINSGNDFLFSAGIWVGAELNGVHHVSTTTDGDNGTNEFYPVHIGTVPASRSTSDFGDWFIASKNFSEFNDRDYVFGVKGLDDDGDWNPSTDDIDGDHKPSADYDGDTLDANGDGNPKYDPEPHIDEDPAGDNTHFFLDPDYHVGPYDDDGDGVADEDGTARGVQEYFTAYHDMISPQYVGSPDPEDPHTQDTWLNVVISQRSYAFPEAYAGDFILIDYRIKNVGQLPLKHVYIAAFADADVGAAGEGGDAASLDDSTYYDPDRLMMVMTDSNTDGDGPAPGQIAVRVVKTPVPLDQLRVTYANFERVSGGDPPTDADKYNLMSSGQIAPASAAYGDWRMVMSFGAASSNGFEIDPGEVLPITIAMMGGADIDQTRTNAEWALAMYLNDFQGPSAPDVPQFTVDVYGDSVLIQWADNSEASVDAITGLSDFEGYTIERTTDQINWETIGAWDIPGDTLAYPFEWQNFNLGMPGDTVVRANGDTVYAPGTRRWVHDPNHPEDSTLVYSFVDHRLIPGHTYYYVVRAFDQGVLGAGILYSGRTGNVISAIMARNATSGAPTDLKSVYVYPNPYKGSHPGESGGQLNPSKGLIEYPRKLYFMGLPATSATGDCIIRIFSLAGDEVAKVNHTNGLEYDQWDLITQNKQEIVSGIYYYVVEYKKPGGGTEQFIDKFVVIK